jgi:hypothetical protein
VRAFHFHLIAPSGWLDQGRDTQAEVPLARALARARARGRNHGVVMSLGARAGNAHSQE